MLERLVAGVLVIGVILWGASVLATPEGQPAPEDAASAVGRHPGGEAPDLEGPDAIRDEEDDEDEADDPAPDERRGDGKGKGKRDHDDG